MPAHPRTVTEPSREIDVIHETDVLVVGSGPGGLAAALAASRAGVHARPRSGGAVTGQGAGVATAVSVRADRPLDDVDISAVQAELIRQDVRIS